MTAAVRAQARRAHPLLSSAEADALGDARVEGWVPQEEWLTVLRARYPLEVAAAIATELYPFTAGFGSPGGERADAAADSQERGGGGEADGGGPPPAPGEPPAGSVRFGDLLQGTLYHALRARLAELEPAVAAVREAGTERTGLLDDGQFAQARRFASFSRRAASPLHPRDPC